MAAGMKRARVAEEDDCKLFIDKYRKARGVLTQANLAEGVELIEKMLGRKYHNKAWGLAALDFTQYVMSGDDKLDSPAQRLALFGDKVMDFELCLIWDNRGFSRGIFLRFPQSWKAVHHKTLTDRMQIAGRRRKTERWQTKGSQQFCILAVVLFLMSNFRKQQM